MRQTARLVFHRPLKIAGIVPLGYRGGPGPFDRQAPKLPGNSSQAPRPWRNKNNRLRLSMEMGRNFFTSPIIKLIGEKFQKRKDG
jgi:hypothetical protein